MKKMLTLVIAGILLLAFGIAQAESYKDAFQFLSPKPGAMYVSQGAYIVLRPGDALSNHYFSMSNPVYLEGSISGAIDYEVAVALDGKTLNIKPYRDFEPGEVITVAIDNGLKARTADQSKDFVYTFTVAPNRNNILSEDDYSYPSFNSEFIPKSDNGLLLDRDVSLPSEWPTITTSMPGTPGNGYIFTAYNNPDPSGSYPGNWGYLMILDNDGNPIFYRKSEINVTRPDVPFSGIVTYGEVLKRNDDYDNKWFAMDQLYNVVDTFEMIGYELDSHGFQLNEDWHSFMFCYDYQYIDMRDSVEGGDSLCRIEGFIIQELDSLKNLVFEWSSWDNLNIMDCQHFDMTRNRINATHINGLDFDYDGNILISIRGFCECMKINITTGNIDWRLTTHGPNSSFSFANDTAGFCWQHNMRPTGTGTYTVFDNGCFHTPQYSRVIEYDLDTLSWTATVVWEYPSTQDIYTAVGGDAMRLPNGNTMIGFSDSFRPPIREVESDGSIAFEIDFDEDPFKSPSAGKRFPWTGIASIPYLLLENIDDGFHLIFNKFGDVPDWYKIYMDTIPNPTTAIDSTVNTYLDVTDVDCGKTYYFRVTALDYTHFESDYSNEESAKALIAYLPGDSNGDDMLLGSDVIFNVNYFKGGTAPSITCWNDSTGSEHFVAADANGDCLYMGSDVTFMVNYFKGGTEPTYCPQTPPLEE